MDIIGLRQENLLGDNCGVFAISAKDRDVLEDIYYGIFYLQHRGPKYCGISTHDGKRLKLRTHRGLVRPTFADDLQGLEGRVGIGHTALKDRQPIEVSSKLGKFTICFSGRIYNAPQLIDRFKKDGHTFHTSEDAELMAKIIAQGDDFVSGIEKMSQTIVGGFTLAILTETGEIYVARDPKGYKPLVLGKKDGSVAIASESCAFNNIGIELLRSVEPGEIIHLKDGEYKTLKVMKSPFKQYCAFEWIYTANLASIIDGLNVSLARHRLGAALARRYPVEADIVSGVPNSGIGHGLGYAIESKIPFDFVFVRYDYAERSYTKSTQAERDLEAKLKLIPIKEIINGKRIVLADDSIVRGTQMKNDLVYKLKNAGAKEVHIRVACPPLMAPCIYGTSTREKAELIGTNKSVEEIRKYIGVDTLGYNTVEDVVQALGFPEKDVCLSCWTDKYK